MKDLSGAFDRCEAHYLRGRHSAIPGAGIFAFEDVIACRRPGAGEDFNKIMGLTDSSFHRLPEIQSLFAETRTAFVVETALDLLSPERLTALRDSGYSRLADMVVLHGDVSRLSPGQASSLAVSEVVSEAQFGIFLDVYQRGLGVPAHLRGHPAFSHWWALPGWHLFLACDSGLPIGAAILFAEEDIAYLATASTIPEYRNRGAQSALLRHRIARAKESGCSRIWTQTEPDSTSMRNMVRAGLAEAFRKQRLVRV